MVRLQQPRVKPSPVQSLYCSQSLLEAFKSENNEVIGQNLSLLIEVEGEIDK